MKETFYFSHDYNARGDERVIKLISKAGWEGYGLYWAIIEKLYEGDGYMEEDYDCIAFDLRTDSDRIRPIINDFKLFKVKGGRIHSESVLHRLRQRKGRSEQARQSALSRWNKPSTRDANAMRTQCDGNAIKESKGKESKVKDSERGKPESVFLEPSTTTPVSPPPVPPTPPRFAPPTIGEVEAEFKTKGVPSNQAGSEASKFFNHYEANGWMVGKNKMKKWKSAIAGWVSRNELGNQASATARRPAPGGVILM